MKNLKKIRLENNMTQEELANILKVDKSTICKWETTNVTPSIKKLEIITRIFKVSYDDLLKE